MKSIKNVVSFSMFVLCMLILFYTFVRVVRPKDGSGIYDMRDFYTLERDTVDVLMLGSSLSFINIDPAVLWEDKGIAAYSLGGAVQPLGNTYFYLEEALKYQSPQLVTLEVFGATLDECPPGRRLNNIEGIRSPLTRFDAVRSCSPCEKWIPLFLGFPEYHNRYNQLSEEDFLPYRGRKEFEYYLGHGTYYHTESCEEPNVNIEIEPIPLSSYADMYLKKIIKLCKDNNIPLLLFSSPTACYNDFKGYYLSVKQVAIDNDLVFIDFNNLYKEMELDFSNDFADGNHLNQDGCPKFSILFGQMVDERFELPDRRGESGYDRWIEASRFYNASRKNYQLSMTENLEDHLFEINKSPNMNDYREIIWVSGNESERVREILSTNGVPVEKGVYICDFTNGSIDIICGNDYTMDFGTSTYMCNEDGMYDPFYQVVQSREDGLTNVVFDMFTMKIADSNYYDSMGQTREKPIEDSKITWVGRGD